MDIRSIRYTHRINLGACDDRGRGGVRVGDPFGVVVVNSMLLSQYGEI